MNFSKPMGLPYETISFEFLNAVRTMENTGGSQQQLDELMQWLLNWAQTNYVPQSTNALCATATCQLCQSHLAGILADKLANIQTRMLLQQQEERRRAWYDEEMYEALYPEDTE